MHLHTKTKINMRKIVSFLAMLLLITTLASAQNRTITGTVTDENGDAVPGASVRIKGTRTGVAADNNGQFKIQAKSGDVLVVSGAGVTPSDLLNTMRSVGYRLSLAASVSSSGWAVRESES